MTGNGLYIYTAYIFMVFCGMVCYCFRTIILLTYRSSQGTQPLVICYIAILIAMENHNFLDYLQPINNPGSCVFFCFGGFSKSKTSKGKSHRTFLGHGFRRGSKVKPLGHFLFFHRNMSIYMSIFSPCFTTVYIYIQIRSCLHTSYQHNIYI